MSESKNALVRNLPKFAHASLEDDAVLEYISPAPP